ncbi:MAG: redoxin domain-containing protein [Anaerolineae bacterium]|jgi:peroxiredoxin|nr:redoxin domain-containing protein [Anaerolineae bacterium]
MAQLRHDYEDFKRLNTEVLVIVPNGPKMIARYLGKHATPYPILSDVGSKVAGLYFQVKQLFALGTPTVILVDKSGRVRYTHYAKSLIEEPDNREPLAVLAQMAGSNAAGTV